MEVNFNNGATFCLREFVVQHSSYKYSHLYDAQKGKKLSSFGLIIKGNACFSTQNLELEATTGDYIFIPDKIQYASSWHGNPDIEFYSIHFSFMNSKNSSFDKDYFMQKINLPSYNKYKYYIIEIYKLMNHGSLEKMSAISKFYELAKFLFSKMDSGQRHSLNPVISKAIEFIEKNYINDFPIKTLAEYCNISQSRLYHLFKENLNTTPITYKNKLKIEKAIFYLRESQYSIEEISRLLNFNSTTYFRKVFLSFTGYTPYKYRKLDYAPVYL